MSQRTGILCKSCKVILNSESDIFGTSCGHLYHFSCIREFHGKSTQCLHCSAYKPMMFKMFIEFEKASQPIPWENQEKSVDVLHQFEESKKANAFLKKAFKISQETIQRHETNIKDLKAALEAKEKKVHELEDRIYTLEELAKYLSGNNDNNKAETKGDSTTAEKYNAALQSKWIRKECLSKQYPQQQISENEKKGNGVEKYGIANNEEFNKKPKETLDDSLPSNTIMIKNLREIDLKDEPFENIILLAKQMGLPLNRAQIKELSTFSERPKYYTLVVELIDENIKGEFIKKKHILKRIPKTKYLEILY